MNLLRHRRLRRRLVPYLDGELDAGPAGEVAAHLRDCWGCSGDAETNRLIRAALRHMGADGTVSLPVVRLQRFAGRLAHG
ncbi:zf-HC2 domain-containing protein [Actinotalea sp.]|uniref:zf-HC2 domain-containing protein n=1 Tax=Actinotalea sp. TaxID=1872145 RepID=UPI00356231A1